MEAKRVQLKLHTRVHEKKEKTASQEEIRRRQKELFLLLYEIYQQNYVAKDYSDAQKDQ